MILFRSIAFWCLAFATPCRGHDGQLGGVDAALGATVEVADEGALCDEGAVCDEEGALVQAKIGLRPQQRTKQTEGVPASEGELQQQAQPQQPPQQQQQQQPQQQQQQQQQQQPQPPSFVEVASFVKDVIAAYAANLTPLYAYPSFAAVVTLVVILAYGNRGAAVVGSILCYIAALSSIKLTVKWVFVHYSYPFAKFVTAMHFTTGALLSFCIIRLRQKPFPVPTQKEFGLMIFPVSLAMVVSVSAVNMALVHSSAAFTEIIGSTGCCFTAILLLVSGMPFHMPLLMPMGLVIGGGIISTVGEVHFSVLGLLLCCLANIFRSLKVALQQRLMTGETKDKFDPVALLLWSSIPSTVVMLATSLLSEGTEPYRKMAGMEAGKRLGLVIAILISCANATVLNLAQLFVSKELGAVGSQLVAEAKSVLTILGGVVIFGEVVSHTELFGFMLVLIGVYLYSWIDQKAKMQAASSTDAGESKADNSTARDHASWTPGR